MSQRILHDLLRKIESVPVNTKVFVDSLYQVDSAYIDEDEILHIEAYRNGKLTIFSVDNVDTDELDDMIWIDGGDESFTIEFIQG